MGISYKKLWMLLLERDIKKSTFRQELNLASGTWTKLNKGEEVSLSILLRICGYLNCDIGETLIIDAKYYTHNMQMKAPYMTQTLQSGNLYQIFTYVKNWSAAPDEVVSGMLLYAGTDDAIQPNNDYQMSGNQISVKTLDMDCDSHNIAEQLDSIADRIK